MNRAVGYRVESSGQRFCNLIEASVKLNANGLGYGRFYPGRDDPDGLNRERAPLRDLFTGHTCDWLIRDYMPQAVQS
jgi:hypothetical protein